MLAHQIEAFFPISMFDGNGRKAKLFVIVRFINVEDPDRHIGIITPIDAGEQTVSLIFRSVWSLEGIVRLFD